MIDDQVDIILIPVMVSLQARNKLLDTLFSVLTRIATVSNSADAHFNMLHKQNPQTMKYIGTVL